MHIIALYAPLFGLLFFVLSLRTIRLRQKLQVGVGDGGNAELLRATRAHANFAEYVPITLIILYLMEASGGSHWLIHALTGLLLLGRALHAYGVSQVAENLRFRICGMALTFIALVGASGCVLVLEYWRLFK